jgi:hypothetical protein
VIKFGKQNRTDIHLCEAQRLLLVDNAALVPTLHFYGFLIWKLKDVILSRSIAKAKNLILLATVPEILRPAASE